MTNKYLIRLDDACPTMDVSKWSRMENILNQCGVRPMVGIIPANSDPKQMIDADDPKFWTKAKNWETKGWAIALHGYDHCYISDKGYEGLNPLWSRSEFAGVALERQKEKIHKGVEMLKSHDINPKYFFAPSHTFDVNTLKALEAESDIRIISDTIATKPYKMDGFAFIPQMGGHCTEIKIPGIWTFCLHPSTMSDPQFVAVEKFINNHKDDFLRFDQLELDNLTCKSLMGRILSWAYFAKRKFR